MDDNMGITGGRPSQQGSSPSVPLGDNSATADIVNQARSRPDGFLYGDDRAIGSPPNWDAQESEQLYNGATMNNDPGTAEATGESWIGHSTNLNQAANDLYNAITELGGAWVGEGAAAAQGTLVGIANSSAQAAEAAQTMGNRLKQQAAAAAEVKKMPAPKEFDPAKQTEAMLAGGPAAMIADMKAQSDAAKDVKAQQVQYFNAYTKAMAEVDSSTPSFGPDSLGLKPMAASVGTGPSSVGGVGSFGGLPGQHLGPNPLAGAPFGAYGASGDVGGPGQTGGVGAGQGHGGHAGAPAAGVPATAGSGMATGAGTAAAAQASGGGGGSGNLGMQLGGAAVGAGLGAAGVKALGKGKKSGSTKQSSTETGASATGQGASAASVAPQNQGMVSSAGTIGGGAVPPAAGPMGGGMGGAARGQAEQEEEHTHASFLIEADPDEAFGATEATPPPVIGAWAGDDEER
ncbi:hypothetical protein [Amycolatopsis marina]|nr:hypothetical protein [Amycolatopsis marina]